MLTNLILEIPTKRNNTCPDKMDFNIGCEKLE